MPMQFLNYLYSSSLIIYIYISILFFIRRDNFIQYLRESIYAYTQKESVS